MPKRTVLEVVVQDVEKRRLPSKHYVFVICVTWSDGNVQIIYRRYSKFFEFQSKLLDSFPEEAGTQDPSRRIIPFLPGKIIFGRSHIREVAVKRSTEIDKYCKALIRLPTKISECHHVLKFFECTEEDLRPPSKETTKKVVGDKISEPVALEQYIAVAEYLKQGRNEATLTVGMLVEVFDKTESGWWFVSTEEEKGWVPSTYLERSDGGVNEQIYSNDMKRHNSIVLDKMEEYVVTQSYVAENLDELSLERGGIVQVIEKNLEGWWTVRFKGKEGLAPAVYMEKSDTKRAQRLLNQEHFGAVQMVTTPAEATGLKPGPSVPPAVSGRSPDPSPVGLRRLPPRNDKQKPQRPPPPVLKEEPVYMTLADFRNQAGDGISFREGQVVQVLDKDASGWWFVKIGEDEGWAPADYIEKKNLRMSQNEPVPKRQQVNMPLRPQTAIGRTTLEEEHSENEEEQPVYEIMEKPQVVLPGGKSQKHSGKLGSTPEPSQIVKNTRSRENASASSQENPKIYANVDVSSEHVSKSVKKYYVTGSHVAQESNELTVTEGEEVTLMDSGMQGWCLVKNSAGAEGWVPLSYLSKESELKPEETNKSQYKHNVMSQLQNRMRGDNPKPRPRTELSKNIATGSSGIAAKPKSVYNPGQQTRPVLTQKPVLPQNKPKMPVKPRVAKQPVMEEGSSADAKSVKNLKSMFENH